MNIKILDRAEDDLVEGFCFYERQQAGLGAYFLANLYADIEEKLCQGAKTRGARDPAWMKGFGGLGDLQAESARIMRLVEEEFEEVEKEIRT